MVFTVCNKMRIVHNIQRTADKNTPLMLILCVERSEARVRQILEQIEVKT